MDSYPTWETSEPQSLVLCKKGICFVALSWGKAHENSPTRNKKVSMTDGRINKIISVPGAAT